MLASTDRRLPLKHLEKLDLNKGSTAIVRSKPKNMERAPVVAVSAPAPAQAEKKKREKLSSLCKTPPSTIKGLGRNFKRGLCLGEVCINS